MKRKAPKCKHGMQRRLCLLGCVRKVAASYRRSQLAEKIAVGRRAREVTAQRHRMDGLVTPKQSSGTSQVSRFRNGSVSGRSFSQVIGGRFSASPATSAAYWLRRKMRPMIFSQTRVLDKDGRHIATITVDPVTGARTRTEITR